MPALPYFLSFWQYSRWSSFLHLIRTLGMLFLLGGYSHCGTLYTNSPSDLTQAARALEQVAHAPYFYSVHIQTQLACTTYDQDNIAKTEIKTQFGSSSGFAIHRQDGYVYLVTNHHTVYLSHYGFFKERIAPRSCHIIHSWLWITQDPEDKDPSHRIYATVVRADSKNDLAILAVKDNPHQPIAILPYELGQASRLQNGNRVWVRGVPYGGSEILLPLYVSLPYIRYHSNPNDPFEMFPIRTKVVLLSERTYGGMSGGPVLAIDCKKKEYVLVGVNRGGFGEKGLFIAVEALRGLLSHLGKPLLTDLPPR